MLKRQEDSNIVAEDLNCYEQSGWALIYTSPSKVRNRTGKDPDVSIAEKDDN